MRQFFSHQRLNFCNKRLSRPRHAGFTLLELSIGLTIVSILAAGALTVGGVVVEQQRFTDTNTRVDEIRQALIDYFKVNGRLPCVAPQNIAMGDTGYGAELTSCATGAAATGATIRIRADGSACSASATDANCVRIGAVPVRTLGLSDAAAADDYGNKLFYAVSEDMTDATKVTAASGRVTIIDGTGATVAQGTGTTGAAFAVVSPGPDGKGAYKLINGVQAIACGSSANLDVENCNNNAVFRDTQFNNGNQAASFYDDIPAWAPKYLLTTASTSTANSLWAETAPNIYAIGTDNDVNTGNVGIGTTSPQNRFDVQQTRTETSGGRYTVARNYMNVAPSAASSAFQTGLTNGCEVTTANNITGDVLCNFNYIYKSSAGLLQAAYGSYGQVNNAGSGTIAYARGTEGFVQNTGNGAMTQSIGALNHSENTASGTITDAFGSYNYIQNHASGSITTAIGVYAQSSNIGGGTITDAYGSNSLVENRASGSITTARGVNGGLANYGSGSITNAYALVSSIGNYGSGQITNGYGLFINDIQATNQWGIYQGGANDNNYFAGSVGIGATPSSVFKLYVRPTVGNSSVIVGDMGSSQGVAIQGLVSAANSWGVYGQATNTGSLGVYGQATNNGSGAGFFAAAGSSYGLLGLNTAWGTYCYIADGVGYALNCNGPNTIVSDRREKKDIETLAADEGLSSLMRLNPVHYKWKDEHRNKQGSLETGFIAQEVAAIYPHLVGDVYAPGAAGKDGKPNPVNKGPKRKSLNYDGLIAPTVLAVQQLKREKDALELRVKALEAELGTNGAGVSDARAKISADATIEAGVFGLAYKELAALLAAMLLGGVGALVLRKK